MLAQKVKDTIDSGHMGKYVNWVERMTEEEYTSVDVAAALVKMMLAEDNK
jgi:ATP-dependent RNA helicase DeaD